MLRLLLALGLGAGLASVCSNVAHALQKPVVVSVYQGPCADGDFGANLATARTVIQTARDRGSHFVAFPECFLSGYESAASVQKGARPLDDPALREFIAESAAHETVVLVGLARRSGQSLFNSVLVIHKGRLLGFYDKILLTWQDRNTLGFTPGTTLPVFNAHGACFGVLICADTSYPHVAMAAKLQGAEILFTPHYNHISAPAMEDHLRWVRNCHIGLATHYQVAVARANVTRIGPSSDLGYGDTFILSPQGTALSEAGLFRTELRTALISPVMFQAPNTWADFHDTPGWLRSGVAELLASFRPPKDDSDLRQWLENMWIDHRFSKDEIAAATGLDVHAIDEAILKSDLLDNRPRVRSAQEPLRVLPYPGGRHPRLGFIDGARNPQRETKVSVFPPWPRGGYVVVDVPEAIFSNLGLIYLAHTHIPTVWDQQHVALPRLEWTRLADGSLSCSRTLPNDIEFGAVVTPRTDGVRMELWLRNGTSSRLTGLRVQNCVMLGHAEGFAQQTLTNKTFETPFAAARNPEGTQWVLTAWESSGRSWGNEQVPCLHSDPVFPDCDPGQTVRLGGWLSFYQGTDVTSEIRRLTNLGLPKSLPLKN